MTPHKPGRIFWTWTFAIGVFSPDKGKRRINDRMQENWSALCEERKRNSELTSEVQFLRRELGRVESEKNLLLLQDHFNAAVIHEAHTEAPEPGGNKEESTTLLHSVEQPLAKASVGSRSDSENPSESL